MHHAVLLADDTRMSIEIQGEYLKYPPVENLTASDGMEAPLHAIKKRPSLVFMDLHMPKMDGST